MTDLKAIKESLAEEIDRFSSADLSSINGFRDNAALHLGFLDAAVYSLVEKVIELEGRVKTLEGAKKANNIVASGGYVTGPSTSFTVPSSRWSTIGAMVPPKVTFTLTGNEAKDEAVTARVMEVANALGIKKDDG